MALMDITIASKTLDREVDLLVILPEETKGLIGMAGVDAKRCKTLYLLHGMSDDHTIWLRRTNIERYAAEKGLAVVMPCADLSYYTDQAMGDRFWQFMTRELPTVCRALFPQLSPRREDTFAAGLSMGGYGALKCGLRAPEVFSRAAGLSSVADVAKTARMRADLGTRAYWEDVFGDPDKIPGSFNDLFAAAEDYQKLSARYPVRFYMWCGTEDGLYGDNVRLRDHMRKLSLPLTYEESPGDHRWEYWDAKIRDVLDWLPLGKEEE